MVEVEAEPVCCGASVSAKGEGGTESSPPGEAAPAAPEVSLVFLFVGPSWRAWPAGRKDTRERGGAARAEPPSPREGTMSERESLPAAGVCGGRSPEDEAVWYVGNCSKCGRVSNCRSVCTEFYLWKDGRVSNCSKCYLPVVRPAETSRYVRPRSGCCGAAMRSVV